jgi:phage head maturation protease
MTKNVQTVFEAKLKLGQQADEGQQPTGLIEATWTTWGAREGADGRKFFYKPEGFAQWADEFKKAGRPLPMFVNHEGQNIPVGEWTDFDMGEEGMSGSGRIFTNTTMGKDLYTVMKESPKMFGGVSVGAYADEYQWVTAEGEVFPAGSSSVWDEGYFQITKGGLSEVSVVMYPNNTKAEISKLEFYRPDGSADLKVFERALRDAGLAKEDAKKAASVFKSAIAKRDADGGAPESNSESRDADKDAANTAQLLRELENRELLAELQKRV